MRRSTKRTLWIIVPIVVAATFVWIAFAVRRGLVAAYCEWGTTCIIASYAEEHGGAPPATWDDLVGYEYHTQYLPTPRTIEYASSHVSVDFQALADFHAGRIDHLPSDVIQTTRGLDAHWINPKDQLERYFRDGERPHGSFNREYADTLRCYAETYPID
ncbi:hypothetical protein [Aporhodopirellula aestuarii]|uniref:Uncharacterized protein n=1 Tax=Aporhodopirellula aestuarii TaxID=2950107 RepID=A0ABT0UH60_9BACT|nr:hypothetical protein [Aporhodopirellula aestuarii]MCM2375266.1 hypothetical protein [Aporhodopirellula aestuarii]